MEKRLRNDPALCEKLIRPGRLDVGGYLEALQEPNV